MPFFMHFSLISLNCTAIESALLPAKSPLPAAEQNVHPPCATVPSRFGQSKPPSNATLNIFARIYFSNGNSMCDSVCFQMHIGNDCP